MQYQSYENFINGFTAVNPFQLAHLSEIMLVQLEGILANQEAKEKLLFSQQDIKYAIIRTMQTLQIEIVERQANEAQYQLDRTKRDVFAPFKVAL